MCGLKHARPLSLPCTAINLAAPIVVTEWHRIGIWSRWQNLHNRIVRTGDNVSFLMRKLRLMRNLRLLRVLGQGWRRGERCDERYPGAPINCVRYVWDMG